MEARASICFNVISTRVANQVFVAVENMYYERLVGKTKALDIVEIIATLCGLSSIRLRPDVVIRDLIERLGSSEKIETRAELIVKYGMDMDYSIGNGGLSGVYRLVQARETFNRVAAINYLAKLSVPRLDEKERRIQQDILRAIHDRVPYYFSVLI
jgi:hypothetical protein